MTESMLREVKAEEAVGLVLGYIVSYGTPMLPGSMLMMAYLDGVPVMGLSLDK